MALSLLPGLLFGKVALVTGAARGLGRSFAQALAEAGCHVVLSDLTPPEEAVAALVEQGLDVRGVAIDVADERSVEHGFAACLNAGRPVEILVNNAGLFTGLVPQTIDEVSMAEWDRVMAVNVRGTFLCARAGARQMRASGYGKIINIASGTVFKGTPFFPHYVASKGAVIALTRSLARELGPDGIRVNAVAAGLVMTETVRANAGITSQMLEQSLSSRAISREQTEGDVCGAVVYLAAPGSDFVTGQTLVVDGGSVMH